MLFDRDFSLFFVGSTLSAIGSAMVPVALSFALFDVGRSAGALGIVLAAQTLPTVVLLLFGGVAGDRWPRRRIMIGSDLLRFAAQSALAVVLIWGAASMPTIIALTALIGAGTAFFYPARGGLIAQIVDANRLARANGALSAANSVATIFGPALAGVIVIAAGAGWAIGIDGLSYAASALCLLFVRLQPEPPRTAIAAPMLRDLREGLSAFASRRWLWLMIAQFGLLNLVAFAPFLVLAPVLLAKIPNGAQAWGLLLSAIGVGGLAGAGAIMRWQPTQSIIAIEIAAAMLATPLILLALHATLPALLAGGIAFGAGASVLRVLIGTLVQREIPVMLVSRVFSVVQIVAGAFAPAGYALAGPASAWLGPRPALAVGAGTVLASVAVLMCFADIRQFGAHRTVVHSAPQPSTVQAALESDGMEKQS